MPSPRLEAAAASTRTEEMIRDNRRAFEGGLSKIIGGFRPGQSSLDAAKDDEYARMELVTAARIALHDALVAAAKGSEVCTADLLNAVNMLDDVFSDCCIGRDVWTARIKAMK